MFKVVTTMLTTMHVL